MNDEEKMRERMKYLAELGDKECHFGICDGCLFDSFAVGVHCIDHPERIRLAQKWLDDHPKKPATPDASRFYKGAKRGDSTYSVTFTAGRLSIYRWHGNDHESIEFGGDVDDFGQFHPDHPEDWFCVAALLITSRGTK